MSTFLIHFGENFLMTLGLATGVLLIYLIFATVVGAIHDRFGGGIAFLVGMVIGAVVFSALVSVP